MDFLNVEQVNSKTSLSNWTFKKIPSDDCQELIISPPTHIVPVPQVKAHLEALQVENDHLTREIAILRETVKVSETESLKFIFKIFFLNLISLALQDIYFGILAMYIYNFC